MTIHSFKYYLHDDYTYEEMVDHLTNPRFGGLPTSVAEAITQDRPFYEVTLDCEYDDVTGQLTMKVVP